jgi:hypothetical protein
MRKLKSRKANSLVSRLRTISKTGEGKPRPSVKALLKPKV